MSAISHNDARLDFRLPSELKAEIERAALAQNRSLTEFATTILTQAARKILAQQEQYAHVQLSNRDRDRFLAMLDRDPTPNRALKAAARRYRQNVV